MTEPNKGLALGMPDFETLIENNGLYVDKTSYLADMISNTLVAVWLLSRPRRFGKSLTVSTLEAIFEKPDSEREKPLFKGLAIEGRLGEEAFAPRPVIKFDMSDVTTNKGADYVETSLARLVAKKAKSSVSAWLPIFPPLRCSKT